MADTDALRAFLDDAHDILRSGDAAEAERHAKAVSALIKAERELAEFRAAQDQTQGDDADAIRAELLGELYRLAAAHGEDADAERPGALEQGGAAERMELLGERTAEGAGG